MSLGVQASERVMQPADLGIMFQKRFQFADSFAFLADDFVVACPQLGNAKRCRVDGGNVIYSGLIQRPHGIPFRGDISCLAEIALCQVIQRIDIVRIDRACGFQRSRGIGVAFEREIREA